MNDLKAAVDYFEMVERNNGPDAMVHFGPVSRVEMLRQYNIARTALTALRDMLKRSEGCEWCEEWNLMEGSFEHPFIVRDFERPAIYRHEWHYCPMCGRKLEDEK